MFCFRHRFHLPTRGKLDFEEPQIALSDEEDAHKVTLRSATNDQPLRESDRIALRGEGFQSEADARASAEAWRSALQRSFAAVRLGADFGDRAPKGSITPAFKSVIRERTGERALNDDHGLMVFECDPPPTLIRMEAAGFSPLPKASWKRALRTAEVQGLMSPQDTLAYDLYSASFFVDASADAKFMLLMMPLETLIDQQPRNQATRKHVDALIALTREAGLAESDIRSIVGSLQWLYVESVTKAGQRLANSLGDRSYGDRSPRKFFTHCYEVRSRLAHGHIPRPSRQEVGLLAAHLEHFVGDLIAGPEVVRAVWRESP